MENKNLKTVYDTLEAAEKYYHAANVLSFDMETICPEGAMEKQGDTMAFLSTEGYKLIKSEEFTRAVRELHENIPEGLDGELVKALYRDYEKIKNLTPEQSHEFDLIRNKAYIDWMKAKQASDFSLFAPSLEKIREVCLKEVSLRDNASAVPYDDMLDDYERGLTRADLDEAFGQCKERLLPLLEKIKSSPKVIRRDFLSRTVTDEAQPATIYA